MRISFVIVGIFSLILINSCAQRHIQTIKSSPENEAVCWQLISANAAEPQVIESLLDREVDVYQEHVEQLLVSTEESIDVLARVKTQIPQGAPIPPAILETISQRMSQDLALVEPVAQTLAQNICWRDATDHYLQTLSLPPLSQQTRIKGILLELAATVTLYDMYLNVIATVTEVERLRTFVNQGDSGYGIEENRIAEITESFADLDNLATVRALIQKYDAEQDVIAGIGEQDERIAYLDILIRSSRAYRELVTVTFSQLLSYKQRIKAHTVRDNLNEINTLVTGGISQSFGNLVGRVEERKGILYGDQELEAYLASILEPGDVLLEKTPFRLTDRLIPGFWGHAAMWVGTEAELKELEIWDHQRVRRYQQQIMNGQLVAEALRQGTVLNTLAHFMNIDDLVILRRKKNSQNDRREALIRVFRQLGKPYDFNFNVETTDRIVCSQLVYIAYPEIAWPTEYIAGRYTISPDNIAAKSIEADLFEIVTLVRDGVIISQDTTKVMALLIGADE